MCWAWERYLKIVAISAMRRLISAPPKGGMRGRLIGNRQMGRLHARLFLVQAVHSRLDQSGCQQGSFRRVRLLPGEKQLLRMIHERREEVGEGGSGGRHRQVHLA